jgi:hypothetical protein
MVGGSLLNFENEKKDGKMVWIYMIAIRIDGDGGLGDEPDLERGGT